MHTVANSMGKALIQKNYFLGFGERSNHRARLLFDRCDMVEAADILDARTGMGTRKSFL
jgi:hypothetical protein